MRYKLIPAVRDIMAHEDLQKGGAGVEEIFEKQQWKTKLNYFLSVLM